MTPGQLEMESGDYIEVFRCRLLELVLVLVLLILVLLLLGLLLLVLVLLVAMLLLLGLVVQVPVESAHPGRWGGSWR